MPSFTLAQALRNEFDASIVRQSETIRDWPPGQERDEQAAIHVRLALWEQGRGRISSATQRRIYAILSFVMPEDVSREDEPAPLAELEREEDVEVAYYEQLKRRSCPECGDGICPGEEIRPPPPAP